ncbi:unnamed protein product, partial [Prunus brigantina]
RSCRFSIEESRAASLPVAKIGNRSKRHQWDRPPGY